MKDIDNSNLQLSISHLEYLVNIRNTTDHHWTKANCTNKTLFIIIPIVMIKVRGILFLLIIFYSIFECWFIVVI